MKIYFTKFFTNSEDDCDGMLYTLDEYFHKTIEEFGMISLYDLEVILTDLTMIKPDYSDIPFEHLKLGYDKEDVKFAKIITRKRKAYNVKGFILEFQFAFVNFKNLD